MRQICHIATVAVILGVLFAPSEALKAAPSNQSNGSSADATFDGPPENPAAKPSDSGVSLSRRFKIGAFSPSEEALGVDHFLYDPQELDAGVNFHLTF